MIKSPSATYETLPYTGARPAILVMAITTIAILMPVILFGELADIKWMSRSIRATQQRGRWELVAHRSAVNFLNVPNLRREIYNTLTRASTFLKINFLNFWPLDNYISSYVWQKDKSDAQLFLNFESNVLTI